MIPAGAACAIAAVAALLLLLGGLVQARRAARPARRAEAPAPARRARWAARPAARAGEDRAASPPSHRGDPRAIYAYAAQVVGQSLAFHGSYRAAAASLRHVPLDWTPPGVRLLVMSNLAQWQLCAGDVEAARRLLPDLDEERAPASVRPLVRGARAAVLVRTGDAEGALSLVGRSDRERDEPSEVRQRYRITRAHALAARGDLAAARAELRRVVDDVGVDELCRWIPAGGPARAAMIELIDAG
ncbi:MULTISPECIES: hypothetical protein [Sorangium]|uniref:Uncharacterized protein n=1 Tax=Sorangium cellulosum TaxID=56 RepID=A0A4P2R3E3_SORCE|nr:MULTISPECIES: hypothetical protein [Sorangium]AUX37547.1 hypothetical protein SOCE836_097740 [Sorangium cellulosum]WCQ96836.1 hypothetical protein NQZ70_09625 [Sorangium sp. Soce836]